MIKIVTHPKTGETYVYEVTETLGGNVYRAAGPIYYGDVEKLTDDLVVGLLDDVGIDAYTDGEWLHDELTAS